MSYSDYDRDDVPVDPTNGIRQGATRTSLIDGSIEIYKIGRGWIPIPDLIEEEQE